MKIMIIKEFEKRPTLANNYTFLVTTLISGIPEGFVGTVYSDGKGKVLGETFHNPYVCNHRKISQPSKEISQLSLDYFVAEEFRLSGGKLPRLGVRRARKIIREFEDKEGYFEFVYGNHLGKNGIYTTGFEKGDLFLFPELLHETLSIR